MSEFKLHSDYAPTGDQTVEGTNKKYYANTALINGEKKTLKSVDKVVVGLYVDPEYNSNGYLTKMVAVTDGKEYLVNKSVTTSTTFQYASGTLIIAGKEYKIADDCKINVYDKTARSLDDWTGSQLANNSKKITGELYGVFKSDKDDTLIELYIYASKLED